MFKNFYKQTAIAIYLNNYYEEICVNDSDVQHKVKALDSYNFFY